MCHQYVIRSDPPIDYTIQKPKPKLRDTLNATVEFKLDKSKMKLKRTENRTSSWLCLRLRRLREQPLVQDHAESTIAPDSFNCDVV